MLREGLPPVGDSRPWLVPVGEPAGGVVRVSAAPLRPVLDRSAGLLAVVAGALLGWWRWRGRSAESRRAASAGPPSNVGDGSDVSSDEADTVSLTGSVRASP